MSLSYKEAVKKANEIDGTLTCQDFVVRKRSRVIEFLHSDGTYCKFVSACFKRITDDWVAIYTEHHGIFVYHTEDIKWVCESIRSKYIYYNKND